MNVTELSRRLCVREHPHLPTLGERVPCGVHRMAGERLYHLTTSAGTHQFEVIRDARDEFLGEPTASTPARDALTELEAWATHHAALNTGRGNVDDIRGFVAWARSVERMRERVAKRDEARFMGGTS